MIVCGQAPATINVISPNREEMDTNVCRRGRRCSALTARQILLFVVHLPEPVCGRVR